MFLCVIMMMPLLFMVVERLVVGAIAKILLLLIQFFYPIWRSQSMLVFMAIKILILRYATYLFPMSILMMGADRQVAPSYTLLLAIGFEPLIFSSITFVQIIICQLHLLNLL